MSFKEIPCKEIITENGIETAVREYTKKEYYCDNCNNQMHHLRDMHYGVPRTSCKGCGKHVCQSCFKSEMVVIHGGDHGEGETEFLCKSCANDRKKILTQIVELEDQRKKVANDIESAYTKLKQSFDKNRNDKKYLEAETEFKELQGYAEAGKHKTLKEMIQKYRRLLKKVPGNSQLAREIEDEIEAYECDMAQECMGH